MSAYGEYNVRKRKGKDKSQVKTSGISEGLSNSCTGALMEREKGKCRVAPKKPLGTIDFR